MTRKVKTSGQIVDELIVNSRRLLIAHICLGVVAAFVYWIRPGTFTGYYPRRSGVLAVMVTTLAWLPYVISWFVSRSLLSGRDSKAAIVFIAVAGGVAALSAACYLNWLEMSEAPSSQ